jgi:hypothetical protein
MEADASRYHGKVILNLIINAVEAMSGTAEAPRELLITAGLAEPSGVLVSVRDSGPALAPPKRPNRPQPKIMTREEEEAAAERREAERLGRVAFHHRKSVYDCPYEEGNPLLARGLP